jgi:hypothetical protein
MSSAQRLLQLPLAIIMVVTTACTSGSSSSEPPEATAVRIGGPVAVELDVFSGMPNPSWTLSDEAAAELSQRVAALPAGAPAALSSALGYRGFIVEATWDDGPAVLDVQDGLVRLVAGDTTIYRQDPGRELERYLLETGADRLAPDLFDTVSDRIGS